MDKKSQTTNTYKNSAVDLARKFDALGVRFDAIKELFTLCKKDNPVVLEIGCGSGKDATEITKYTTNYTGIDISENLIAIAKQKSPTAHFQVADIETYSLPTGIDIIIAFASLIHSPKEILRKIIDDCYLSLTEGGMLRISMKYAPQYKEVTREDDFGTRTYYHYSDTDLAELCSRFVIRKNEVTEHGGQIWVELLAQK